MERIVFIAGQLNVEIECREAAVNPGRTLVKDTRITLGGRAFRQAMCSKSLGMNVILLGRVGNDHHGKMILESLAKAGISSRYVEEAETGRTGLSVRILAEGGLRHEYFDPGANLGEIDYQIPIEYYLHLCDAIVVNKWCSLSLRKTILATAREHTVPCVYVHSGTMDDEERGLVLDFLFLDGTEDAAVNTPGSYAGYTINRGVFIFSPGNLRLLSPQGDEVYAAAVPEGLDADSVVARLAANLFPETKLRETAAFLER